MGGLVMPSGTGDVPDKRFSLSASGCDLTHELVDSYQGYQPLGRFLDR